VLSAGLYTGVARRPDQEYVTFSVTPGHGEIIAIPMQSFEGDVTVVLFECRPGGDLEVLARTPYADDPKGYERTVVEKLRAYCPPISQRLDDREFALTRPDSILQGAVTPMVRRSHAKLDNGRYAIAVGDAHVAMDPVVGLGANSASLGAWTLGEAILEGGPFDEQFCQKVDERRLPGVLAHFEFTNIMLAPPPPHVLEVIGAMSQNLALANDFTNNFTDPGRHLANLATPEAAAAYVASFPSPG
jgi:2-polyprenyl-6-methoxyphenol hydroxylase-like FAD-dependent oxidoreductase